MKFLGVDFVPLNEPFHRKVETFWAGFWFVSIPFGYIIFTVLLLYLLTTPLWWITPAILLSMFLDRNTCEEDGRSNSWVQNWSCFRSVRDYYNGQVVYDDGFKLDPNQNYIFCSFPHGIIPVGPVVNFLLKSSKFRQQYPQFLVKFGVLRTILFVPILKDILLSLGFIACSVKSLNFCLNKSKGGIVVILSVGGAEEALYSKPGRYKFVVKNRKGFVKIALKHGAHLVPSITFGEPDLFDNVEIPLFGKIQVFVKKYSGFFPLIFNGRGLFQNSFGLFPRRIQLTTVVGKPIEVRKMDSPTMDEIDHLHAQFVEELQTLFEKYKHKYIENAQNTFLEIV